jgi:predicted CopG family antitoxin
MARRVTITLDDDVYEGLRRVAGRGHMSDFVQSIVRSHVSFRPPRSYTPAQLEEDYRLMAADEQSEREALEWANALLGDVADEPR